MKLNKIDMGARETCSALKLKFKTDNNNLSNI